MKKFIFAATLFFLLLACGIWYQHTVTDFTHEVDGYMQSIERLTYANDRAALEKAFDAFDAYWSEKRGALSYLIDHVHLNAVNVAAAELGMAIDAQSEADVLMAAARVKTEARCIARDESFLPENIF